MTIVEVAYANRFCYLNSVPQINPGPASQGACSSVSHASPLGWDSGKFAHLTGVSFWTLKKLNVEIFRLKFLLMKHIQNRVSAKKHTQG